MNRFKRLTERSSAWLPQWILLGAAALVAEMGLPEPRLVVDWGVIGLVVAGVLLAAAAASVLPGRRAAQAAPVEALADVG